MTEIFHRFVVARLGQALQHAIREAQQEVIIIAPFITAPAFQLVLGGVPQSVHIKVITRWRVDEVAAGVSDPTIFDELQRRGRATILLHDDLHAKAYMVDERVLISGSANITLPALGFAKQNNIELLSLVSPVPTSFFVLLRRLDAEGLPATPELKDNVLRLAADFQRSMPAVPSLPSHAPVRDSTNAMLGHRHIPCFRSPDRFYDAYRSIPNISSVETRRVVLDDILLLQLEDGLGSIEFEHAVRQALLDLPFIERMNSYLGRPRRFGELTRWVKNQVTDLDTSHEEAQRMVQTLIRWLTYFAPDIYQCKKINVSEVLYKRNLTLGAS